MDTTTAELDHSQQLVRRTKARQSLIALAFTLAVFLSAALLFVVEPMFGKMVLPLLGGSPAVWTTCMLFFQGALLVGYLYAHVGPRWLGLGGHTILHIVLLTLCVVTLPISVAGTSGAFRFEHPNVWLLWVLTLSLGAPFVLLSSTGPLLQVWFSKTTHPDADRPYFLYAASNAGSLIALVSYPFLIEPLIPLQGQSRFWSVGFFITISMVAVSAAYLRTGAKAESGSAAVGQPPTVRLERRTMLRWTVLAFVPSSFFLALTTYVTTDVASVPLLWIIPLVLYLLSFTMVFGRRSVVSHGALLRWQPVGLIALAVIQFLGNSASGLWLLPLHLIVFFGSALVCHGELAATKPDPSRLTDFYLCIAVGGVLGGVFNALLAPALFNSVLEYPLTILVACAVRPWSSEQRSSQLWGWDLAVIAVACAVLVWARLGDAPKLGVPLAVIFCGIAAVACLRTSRNPARFTLAVGLIVFAGMVSSIARPGILMRERNFFGVREVREDTDKQLRMLMHGTTSHGAQSTVPSRRLEPVSYYHRRGPVGDVFRALPPVPGRKVGIIGLGAGGLASYAGGGEEWTFYEIDPDIARVAADSNYFTYLRDTPAKVDVVLGDGRLALAQAPDRHYDMLVLDAFSSDAIPTHLLTLEALSLYRSKLSEKGVLVLHLSNRYLELEPVVGRLVRATGAAGLIRADVQRTAELEASGDPSVWAAVASERSHLGALQEDPKWRPLSVRDDVAVWTDDFSNIFSVFIWSIPRRPGVGAGGKVPSAAPAENMIDRPSSKAPEQKTSLRSDLASRRAPWMHAGEVD
jgi:hypothetical protein